VSLSPAERRDWLRLARTDNVGPVAFSQLMSRFGSPGRALAALPDLASPRRPQPGPDAAHHRGPPSANWKPASAWRPGLLTLADPEFPRMLAAVDPPPPVLWVRGDAGLLNRPTVAIVGARIASAAGQRFARGLAADLGRAGLVVVSGLARGIDGAAHEGALPTGTAAVLGGGVDDVYPPEHADLYARLVEQGCIVSESEIGRRAQAKDFPRRNRIISGLSAGVVGGRGRDALRLPDHRPPRRRTGPRRLCRAGLPARPARQGHERPPAPGRHPLRGAEDVLRGLNGPEACASPTAASDRCSTTPPPIPPRPRSTGFASASPSCSRPRPSHATSWCA
jgi:DNA processing protein